MKTTRIPTSSCWHCHYEIDSASGAGHHKRPRPGSLSICVKCGQPSIFTGELKLREPSQDEWLEIGGDKIVQAMLKVTKEAIERRRK